MIDEVDCLILLQKRNPFRMVSHFYYQPHNVTDTHHYVVLKELSEELDAKRTTSWGI